MGTRKILVVDDEEDIREILKFNLENAGYEVECAASAEEALAILSPSHSLILLDVMMSGMSGFKMTEVLRKELKNPVPIIFLTAKGTENDLLTGFSAGGDDYISKPFSIHEVLARVRAVVKRAPAETIRRSGWIWNPRCCMSRESRWCSQGKNSNCLPFWCHLRAKYSLARK